MYYWIRKKIKILERVVCGTLDTLRDIGGLYEIIKVSSSFTISFIIKSLYDASLLKQLFLESKISEER